MKRWCPFLEDPYEGKEQPMSRDPFGITSLDVMETDPCVIQGLKMGTSGFLTGGLIGAITVYWRDRPPHELRRRGSLNVVADAARRIGKYGGLCALATCTFGSTHCAIREMRTPHDPLNPVLAGGVTGAVIGACMKRTIFASFLGASMMTGMFTFVHFFRGKTVTHAPLLDRLRQRQAEQMRTSLAAASPDANDDAE